MSQQFEPFDHTNTGLPLGAVDALQSHFNAKPKGKTVLHTDVGFLPRLPQCPGVNQIPMEVCLQGLRATKHKDYVFSRLFFPSILHSLRVKNEKFSEISHNVFQHHTPGQAYYF